MMKVHASYIYRIPVLCLFVLLFSTLQAYAFQIRYMGNLANFEGIVPSLWSKITVDKEHAEAIILNPRQRDVRIFNAAGMEIFSFGDNVELSGASDIELGEDGDIYLVFPGASEQQIHRLDYKGDPIANFGLKEVPDEFLPFNPQSLQYIDGKLYLADMGAMNIIITDMEGSFQQGYHVKRLMLQLEEEFAGQPGEDLFKDLQKFEFLDMAGFSADSQGNMYFTVSSIFSAFKLSPDGKLKLFGKSGSGPGKFGVVAGITTDSQGYIYVSDRLRSVVMIFDANFEFITEFGYRGLQPGRLIVPDDVVVDDRNGYIYVAQAANRGVSVYRIMND